MMAWVLILLAMSANAADITAATCGNADVQTAINSAIDGDTVIVPNGSCSWSSGVSVSGKGIHLQGQTKGSVIITHNAGTATAIAFTRDASHHIRMSNLNLIRGAGSGRWLTITGSTTDKVPLIHDNYFDMKSIAPLQHIQFSVNGGVVWNNEFRAGTVKPPPGGAGYGDYHFDGCIQVNPDSAGDAIWAASHTLGNVDSTGTENTYFEDNIWEGCLQQSVDGSNGSKTVIRYNTSYDSAWVMHGNDTDSYGGCRHFEFYNNTINRVYDTEAGGAVPINRWFYIRGCTGIIANNVIPDASTSDTYYPGKPEIDLTIQALRRNVPCYTGAYPMPHQVGQITDSPDATPDFPIAIYGNTGAGTSSGNFIILSNYSPDECSGGPDISEFVEVGRDWVLSAPGGYTAYTYPHPLRDEGGGGGGATTSSRTGGRTTGRIQ